MSEKLEVGSIVEGKIVRIKPFGAIVSLGTSQGLVHISQVANSFVQDINDHITVGDIVKVKILSIDEESHKIALSIRDALPREERPHRERSDKPFRKPNQTHNKPFNSSEESFRPQAAASPTSDFEDKMKEWAKQSNERHTSLNKRANKRSY